MRNLRNLLVALSCCLIAEGTARANIQILNFHAFSVYIDDMWNISLATGSKVIQQTQDPNFKRSLWVNNYHEFSELLYNSRCLCDVRYYFVLMGVILVRPHGLVIFPHVQNSLLKRGGGSERCRVGAPFMSFFVLIIEFFFMWIFSSSIEDY